MSSRPDLRLPGVRRAGPDVVVDDGCLVVRVQAPVPDVVRLCDRVHELLQAAAVRGVVCEVHDPVDLSVVDAVARLQLTARRRQRDVRLCAVGQRATELLGLCGLTDVVPLGAARGSEPGRQPETREQRGVEEVVDVRHLPL